MEFPQNENYLSSDLVNQDYGQNFNKVSIKRYEDLSENVPINASIKKQINTFNSHYDMNNMINSTINQNIQETQNKFESNNILLEKSVIPERTLSNFYGKDFLADANLKVDEFEVPFHKIILCAASDFIYKYFTLNQNVQENQKTIINLPEVMKSDFSRGNNKDCIDKILKYCYNNQDIKSIESDITQNNVFKLLELSHSLGIKSLNQNLEKLIIKHFLKDDNMIKLSEESNNYELPELHKECSNKIKKCMGNVTNKAKELTELKYDTFKDIISSDELDIEGEKDVADLVIEYIRSRREIPEDKPLGPLQNQVNVENKENEEKKESEEKKEEEKKEEEKKEEEKKNEEPPQNQENQEQNENGQNQENKNPPNNQGEDLYDKWKKHLIEIKKNWDKKRLTPEEEKALIYCIRFSFLSHTDLISLTNEPIMKDYKDLLLQGLSARLNSYENTNEPRSLINATPRKYLREQQASNKNQNYSNNSNINNDINQNYFKSQKLRSVGNFGDPNQFIKRSNNNFKNFAQSQRIIPQRNNNYNMNLNNNYSHSPSYYDENESNDYNYNNNYNNNIRSEVLNIDDLNSKKKKLAMMIKSSSPHPPQDPYISEEFFKNQLMMSIPKPIFKYTYDFDENGALYFLGTKGKRYQYRNPHEINMVKAFASSLSKGNISDFVGRELTNLRTENEENSFFGVDLGSNRTLVPSAYSIRNRNSSSHVMLCWNLEASNDRLNFEILDTRIFSNKNNPQIHQKLEKERNLLKQPGCTSTWGISKKVKERFPDGFRYFLLKQIDKNSNGSYNLAISGFELYGEGKGRGWVFN